MRLAKWRDDNSKLSAGGLQLPSSLREMTGQTTRERKRRRAKQAYESILREVEADIYSQGQQTIVDEVQLHRDMALELIDVGFKALATRLHPDRGGSKEAM